MCDTTTLAPCVCLTWSMECCTIDPHHHYVAHFGPQCDAAGARILQRYASMRQFGHLVKNINQKKGVVGVPDAATIDPREVHCQSDLTIAQLPDEQMPHGRTVPRKDT